MVDRLNPVGVGVQRRRAPSRWRTVVVSLVVLVALLAGADAVRIHHHDGQWAFVPSVAPDRLTVGSRDYRRGSLDTEAHPAWVKRGTTSGGGTIYTQAHVAGTPMVLWVRKGDKVWGYDLIGGP